MFNLYKDDKTFLGDETLYPNNFEGNKIFGHKEGTGTNDTEYGFPFSYKAFKSASEIDFENFALLAVNSIYCGWFPHHQATNRIFLLQIIKINRISWCI